MTLIFVKNHAVFIKPFWYYWKVLSGFADHNISVFDWRIHVIAIYIVAKCTSLNKKEEVINKNVEK